MRIRLSARYEWEAQDAPPFFDRIFQDSRITIGNDPAASLCLNGSVLSPEQIVIVDNGSETLIVNQAEGASLNGETLALNSQCPLQNGDVLRIGTYKINIFLGEETEAPGHYEAPGSVDDALVIGSNNSSPSQVADGVEQLVQDSTNSNGFPPVNEETTAFSSTDNQRAISTKSFAAILDSLRTDEDRFYFVVEGSEQATGRVPIELEQMLLGWDESGQRLCFDVPSITDICAIVRKDWSGVIFQTQSPGVAVNNEPLEGERRLRDGDRVSLTRLDNQGKPYAQVVLIFREPTSLVILDSLMPGLLPVRENGGTALVEGSSPAGVEHRARKPFQRLSRVMKSDREYFGAFTFVELSLMAIGTVVGAVIIFLILNYS